MTAHVKTLRNLDGKNIHFDVQQSCSMLKEENDTGFLGTTRTVSATAEGFCVFLLFCGITVDVFHQTFLRPE